jgi:hypothetical protein
MANEELHPTVPEGTVLPPPEERGTLPAVIPPIDENPPFPLAESQKEGK